MPKRALTDASVKRLKPPTNGQQDIFDRGYPGLCLRISYGGGKSWAFFYRFGLDLKTGKPRLRRMRLGIYPAMSLAEARETCRAARHEVMSGRDPSQAKKSETGATDFIGVFHEWLRRDQAKNRSHDEVKRLIEKNVLPTWGERRIADIGRRDVLDVIDAIVDRGAPITACRVHAHLRRLFTWSVGRGIIAASPMANMPRPAVVPRRERVLNDDELRAVWQAAEHLGWPFGSALKLLILTGARREEIGQLRWNEIAGNVISLDGARTKNGESHLIPLSKPALAVIESGKRIAGSQFVFSLNGMKHIRAWSHAKSRLDELVEIAPWRIHDLRRTTATGLQKLKTPLQVTEAILGHTAGSRAGVIGIYQRHDYADEKRAALETWGAHVMALVQP
jgi:integrase